VEEGGTARRNNNNNNNNNNNKLSQNRSGAVEHIFASAKVQHLRISLFPWHAGNATFRDFISDSLFTIYQPYAHVLFLVQLMATEGSEIS
jgi:hypothetical protein